MVQSVWDCPHLTSLQLIDVPCISLATIAAVYCTGLRQLQLQRCVFGDDGAFPPKLCYALGRLTSLATLATVFWVPREFSILGWAGAMQRMLPDAVALHYALPIATMHRAA